MKPVMNAVDTPIEHIRIVCVAIKIIVLARLMIILVVVGVLVVVFAHFFVLALT